MKLIPIEDFILQLDTEENERYKREGFKGGTKAIISAWEKVVSYAKFLKTPMLFEHFHGRHAVVKIKDVSVLKPVNGKTGKELDGMNLLFVPDDDNEDWPGTFTIGPAGTFAALVNQPGVELTEEGVKLIFG